LLTRRYARYQLSNCNPEKYVPDLGPRILTDTTQVGIITTALRCSAYLSILFNWDKHKIFCGSTSLFKSKNLVLETAYSIAYRIQDLIKLVEYEVRESLRHPKSTSDPATVSCALWILYRSIKSQRKVDWRASSLQSLVFPYFSSDIGPQLTFNSKNF
jgi:hypothetical protein